MNYLQLFWEATTGYANYIWYDITHPSMKSYFYWLIAVSLFCWGLERLNPWRKDQALFRKDFWLDAFYMFFNFFLFYLIGFAGISEVGVQLYKNILDVFSFENTIAFELAALPIILQFGILFILRDFIHWNVHRLLHRSSFLWKFHQLHHSVKEMGFAAHLRFHWMESIFYKSAEFLILSFFGFGIDDLFFMHQVAIVIGHLNHSNLNWDYGPFRYLLNNPKMHIWHHAKALPNKYGVNFGISLSIWDYLFKTAYTPSSGRDIELGFPGDENYPKNILNQWLAAFKK